MPPSGPHSRLYAQFEVRGGGRRRFPAPPGIQRRPPRRVQRSRCPVKRAHKPCSPSTLAGIRRGTLTYAPLSNLTRDRSRGTEGRTQGRSERTPGNSFCDDSHPSPTFVLGHKLPRNMQNLDRPAYCQPCQKPTNHQIQYRSDPDCVGRVLVCEDCGQRKLEPLRPGTCCQDC